ncbi:MAG: hypothetical protein OXG44_12715 [Gammaproteobacteria bacterium]|nr:hypothetical protein [Gammaproteobacteria bacterium]
MSEEWIDREPTILDPESEEIWEGVTDWGGWMSSVRTFELTDEEVGMIHQALVRWVWARARRGIHSPLVPYAQGMEDLLAKFGDPRHRGFGGGQQEA